MHGESRLLSLPLGPCLECCSYTPLHMLNQVAGSTIFLAFTLISTIRARPFRMRACDISVGGGCGRDALGRHAQERALAFSLLAIMRHIFTVAFNAFSRRCMGCGRFMQVPEAFFPMSLRGPHLDMCKILGYLHPAHEGRQRYWSLCISQCPEPVSSHYGPDVISKW